MAKRTQKTQEELDNAVDSLGGGTIRPATRRAGVATATQSGTRKPSPAKKPTRAVKRR